MVSPEKLEELVSILQEMTTDRRATGSFHRGGPWSSCLFWLSLAGMVIMLIVMAVMKGAQGGDAPMSLDGAVRWVVVLFYVFQFLMLLTVLVDMFRSARMLWKRQKRSMKTLLSEDVLRDAHYVSLLSRFDRDTLDYGLIQYRHRWRSFDGRVAILAGNLRSLGLFPAAFSANLAAIGLYEKNVSIWLWLPLVLMTVFHVVAMIASIHRERPDQVIELLEHVLRSAHAAQEKSESGELHDSRRHQ